MNTFLVYIRVNETSYTLKASTMASSVQETNYEDELFQYPVGPSMHCCICTNVIKDPVMCHNEHIFCRACITTHLMYSPTCPTCMQPLTVETLRQAPRGIRNMLDEFSIRCEFFDRGCGKFVQVGDLVLLRFLLLFHLIPINGCLPCQSEDVIMVLQAFSDTILIVGGARNSALRSAVKIDINEKKTPLSALKNTFNCANDLSMFCAWLDVTSHVQNF